MSTWHFCNYTWSFIIRC